MATGNPDLIELMRAEIEKRGPQSFAWFMQQALYHIDHGYYSSGRCAIGRKGDYFTSVSVGALFGQLLAAQFVEIWERLGRIEKFMIVEQGAHDGQFARDVLNFVQDRAPEFFGALRYRIVEPFPVLQERQTRTLRGFHEKVEWFDSLQPFTGVHFSNELLDAMPVRLIANNKESLVGLDGDRFVFVERDSGDPMFNGAVLTWVDEVAANLERGYIVAIDYGHFQNEFRGNIQVRARHRNLDSPFEKIGEGGHHDAGRLAKYRRLCANKRIADRRVHRSTSLSHRNHLNVAEPYRGPIAKLECFRWKSSRPCSRS